LLLLLQATVVHDVNAIEHDDVSNANRVTIGDLAMSKFQPLKPVAALKQAGKQ